MQFEKIEGAGNDFIVVESPPLQTQEIVKLCDRRKGIGADGLIFVSTSARVDYKFSYYNCDGSHADFCGNGLRAVARFVGRNCTIESDCGLHFAKVLGDDVSVNLPPPKFVKKDFFAIPEGMVHYVHVGVPHGVLQVEDFSRFPELAQKLRHDPRFGVEGANIHFAKKPKNGKVEVRTFERGIEKETFACGSGGAAVFLCSDQRHATIWFFSRDEVRYFFDKGHLMMQGPARKIFTGKLYDHWHSERDQNSRISRGSHAE